MRAWCQWMGWDGVGGCAPDKWINRNVYLVQNDCAVLCDRDAPHRSYAALNLVCANDNYLRPREYLNLLCRRPTLNKYN